MNPWINRGSFVLGKCGLFHISWIKGIPQRISDEVDADYQQENDDSSGEPQPGLAGQNGQGFCAVQDVSEGGCRGLDTHTEERKGCLIQNGNRKDIGCIDEDGRDGIGKISERRM